MSKDEDADDPFALWMPAFGKIEGGRLDGYRYTFHRFVGAGAQLKIEATVTPPNWPFPKLRLLEPADYDSLLGVPGERAKRIRANGLIAEAAFEAALKETRCRDEAPEASAVHR